jgi:hypothetical protein
MAGEDLCPSVGDVVQRGELLEHANGVRAGQHRDAGGEADPGGLSGDGSQYDLGSGHAEIGTVVLAPGDDVQAAGI